MVALNDNLTGKPEAGTSKQVSADHFVSLYLLGDENQFLFVGPCSLIIERSADAYGNTVIFTGPGTDGIWFTDDDVQSSYGANEIIYCGYPDSTYLSKDIGTGLFDPETELHYVRNRIYNPALGRWLQRDPVGYAGGINLYEYVGGRAVTAVYPPATQAFPLPPPPPGVCSAGCRDELIICIVVSTADADTTFFACVSSFYACLAIICDDLRPPWPPPGPPPGPQLWTWPPESC
jgi:RHS repeat-associated protein